MLLQTIRKNRRKIIKHIILMVITYWAFLDLKDFLNNTSLRWVVHYQKKNTLIIFLFFRIEAKMAEGSVLSGLTDSWFASLLLNLLCYSTVFVPGYFLIKYFKNSNYHDRAGIKYIQSPIYSTVHWWNFVFFLWKASFLYILYCVLQESYWYTHLFINITFYLIVSFLWNTQQNILKTPSYIWKLR